MEKTALVKTVESRMRIRFHDCDPFGHLNNSRYIDYMVAARTDHLADAYAFDVHQIAREEKTGWVAAQTQISYFIPANPDEEVVIQTQLISYSEKGLLFEASMWNKDKTVLKAFMWTKLVYFNLLTRKSHPHSEKLLHFFEQIVNPLETNFEQRVKNIRQPA